MSRTFQFENAHLIFGSNLRGDPNNTKTCTYPGLGRWANLRVPEDRVAELAAEGVDVKVWTSENGQFPPIYYTKMKIKFNADKGIDGTNGDPVVKLRSEGNTVALNGLSIAVVDDLNKEKKIDSVNVLLNTYANPKSEKTDLYINVMYVFQKEVQDPWAGMYEQTKMDLAEEEQPF